MASENQILQEAGKSIFEMIAEKNNVITSLEAENEKLKVELEALRKNK